MRHSHPISSCVHSLFKAETARYVAGTNAGRRRGGKYAIELFIGTFVIAWNKGRKEYGYITKIFTRQNRNYSLFTSMTSKYTEWLKEALEEGPSEGPEAKRMKFSDLQELLQKRFQSDTITNSMAVAAVQEAFPMVITGKRLGKRRITMVLGVAERKSDSTSSDLTSQSAGMSPSQLPGTSSELAGTAESVASAESQLRAALEAEQKRNQELCDQVRQLQTKVQLLEGTVRRLESEQSSGYVQQLDQQMEAVVRHRGSVMSGPDTSEHFGTFSVDSVISEVKQNAPDVYQLFQVLGKTSRNAQQGQLPTEELKAAVSLATLLNARSNRVKGIQLLLGIMLIARATHKHVSFIMI